MSQLLLRKRMHIDHVIHHTLLNEDMNAPSWYEQEDVLLVGPFPSPMLSAGALAEHVCLETNMTWCRAVYQDVGHCVIVDANNYPVTINAWESAITVSQYYYTPSLLLHVILNTATLKHREMLINLVVEKMGQAGEYCPRWKYDVSRLLVKHLSSNIHFY